MFTNYYAFEDNEFARIVNILRAAFAIRTADGEEDELLGDFIEALEERAPIVTQEIARKLEEQE